MLNKHELHCPETKVEEYLVDFKLDDTFANRSLVISNMQHLAAQQYLYSIFSSHNFYCFKKLKFPESYIKTLLNVGSKNYKKTLQREENRLFTYSSYEELVQPVTMRQPPLNLQELKANPFRDNDLDSWGVNALPTGYRGASINYIKAIEPPYKFQLHGWFCLEFTQEDYFKESQLNVIDLIELFVNELGKIISRDFYRAHLSKHKLAIVEDILWYTTCGFRIPISFLAEWANYDHKEMLKDNS